MLTSFDCKITKGEFPHLFVNCENFNYVGPKPDISYFGFTDISKEEYANIPNDNWSLKVECLKYLKKDIL